MPTRSLAWRDWKLTVSVPARFSPRSRRPAVSRAMGSLTFLDPPPRTDPLPRDPIHALAFIGIAADRGDEHAVKSGFDDDVSRQIRAVHWYHTIELPGGIVTPGEFDHRQLVPRYGLPQDMQGLNALDVATFDGFWAFEMERRGAHVTAIDLDTSRDLDFPKLVRPVVDDVPNMPVIGDGFRIAHAALGSSVQRVSQSVYALSPESTGMFDLVHCGDLLLHLRDPLTALERIRSVTAGRLLLCDVIDLDVTQQCHAPLVNYRGGWDDVVWWIPSLDALAQMAVDAGFRNVRVNAVYQLAKTYDETGAWRASLIADT